MRGNVVRVATNSVTQFTDALITGAAENENVVLPGAIAAGMHCRSIVRHLVVASVEQLAWEIVFFATRSFQTAPLPQSSFISSFQFSAGNSKQYAPGGPFYYQAANIDLPYQDLDFENTQLPPEERGGKLHLMLVNRSPGAKTAGPNGAIQIICYMEPTYG